MRRKTPALSVRQPWAMMIVLGRKPYEFRSWDTHYRGKVYIYASMRIDPDQELHELTFDTPRGKIIGSVHITHSEFNFKKDCYQWKLDKPHLFKKPRKTKKHPQPGFFYP